MAESNVNKVPTVAIVFGWLSMVLSFLGIIGAVALIISGFMPSYQGTSVLIQAEDARKIGVFFIGAALGYVFSFQGGLSGIVSLIIMLVKKNRKMIWLPITGIAIGMIAFVVSVLATVILFD